MAKYKIEIAGINTNNLTVLKQSEMLNLFKSFNQGDEQAREKLIEGNLKLVFSIVRKLNKNKYNMDDLFQIGCIGLIKAVENFDLAHNVKFSTYAVPMISGEIKRFIRDNSSVRVSRSIKEIAYNVIRYKEEYEKEKGKEPSSKEIAQALDITEFQVTNSLESLRDPMSMYDPIYNSGEDTIYLEDQIKDDKAGRNLTELIALRDALSKLNKREANILYSRYIDGLTQAEVAEFLNISQAQVSRLEKSAMVNVRKQLN